MKKTLLTLIFVLFATIPESLVSQTCTNEPNNWHISVANGSKQIGTCATTHQYNCHAYSIAYVEGMTRVRNWGTNPSTGNTPYHSPWTYWNYRQGGQSSYVISPAEFRNNNDYFQVGSSSDADIVYYEFGAGVGHHSAVRDRSILFGTPKFLSKYGPDGPLVAHELNTTFYEENGAPLQLTEFYTRYTGNAITGDNSQSVNDTDQYTIPLLPAGLNVQWVINDYRAQIIGSSTSAQVSVKALYPGTYTLKATVSSTYDSRVITKQITVTSASISGTYNTSSSNGNQMNTVNFAPAGTVTVMINANGATSYTWQKTSGSISFPFSTGSSKSFTMTTNGSLSLLLKAYNGGSLLTSRTVTFAYSSSGGGWIVNPGNSYKDGLTEDQITTISPPTISELNYVTGNFIDIVNMGSGESQRIQNVKSLDEKTISELKAGLYAIHIYRNHKRIERKKLLKRE